MPRVEDELITRTTLLGVREFVEGFNTMSATVRSFMGITSSLGGVSFLGQGFQRLGQYETSLVKLTVATGNYAEAVSLMQQAQDLSNRTPLQLQDVVNMMLILQPIARATGRDVIHLTRMAGDAAAMFGQFGEDAVQFARDIATAAVGSGAGMEGLRYRTNFVINLMREDFQRGGRYAGRTFMEAIETELRRFSGAMEIMSTFTRGAVTTIDDMVGLLQRRFVSAFSDTAATAMLGLSNAIADTSEDMQKFIGLLMFARPLLERIKIPGVGIGVGTVVDTLLFGGAIAAAQPKGSMAERFFASILNGFRASLAQMSGYAPIIQPLIDLIDSFEQGMDKARQQVEAARQAMQNMARVMRGGDFTQFFRSIEREFLHIPFWERAFSTASFASFQKQMQVGSILLSSLRRDVQVLSEQALIAQRRYIEALVMFMRTGDPNMFREARNAYLEMVKAINQTGEATERVAQQRHRLAQITLESLGIELRWFSVGQERAERERGLEERRIALRERGARALLGNVGELMVGRQALNERMRLIDQDTAWQNARIENLRNEYAWVQLLYLTREEKERRLADVQSQIDAARARVSDNELRKSEAQMDLFEKIFRMVGQDRALVGMAIGLARGTISPATIQQMGGRVMAGGMPGMDLMRALGMSFLPGYGGLPRLKVEGKVVLEDEDGQYRGVLDAAKLNWMALGARG